MTPGGLSMLRPQRGETHTRAHDTLRHAQPPPRPSRHNLATRRPGPGHVGFFFFSHFLNTQNHNENTKHHTTKQRKRHPHPCFILSLLQHIVFFPRVSTISPRAAALKTTNGSISLVCIPPPPPPIRILLANKHRIPATRKPPRTPTHTQPPKRTGPHQVSGAILGWVLFVFLLWGLLGDNILRARSQPGEKIGPGASLSFRVPVSEPREAVPLVHIKTNLSHTRGPTHNTPPFFFAPTCYVPHPRSPPAPPPTQPRPPPPAPPFTPVLKCSPPQPPPRVLHRSRPI